MNRSIIALLLILSTHMYSQRCYMHNTWLFHVGARSEIQLEDMQVERVHPAIDISIPQKDYLSLYFERSYLFAYKGNQAICLITKEPITNEQKRSIIPLQNEGEIPIQIASNIICSIYSGISTNAGKRILRFATKNKHQTDAERECFVLHSTSYYIMLYNIKKKNMTLFLDCARSFKEYPIPAPLTKRELEEIVKSMKAE